MARKTKGSFHCSSEECLSCPLDYCIYETDNKLFGKMNGETVRVYREREGSLTSNRFESFKNQLLV